ncbi:M56 family metallopeptidase [Phosphitispora fastidiosa]|uniref:M56 family metallopeptidase n=1 Tax=Phosphitispora fastidiosa TaxID=2837202 RepID=UPI001E47BC9B|nr:M56 family metallopeptidase [Phosphitispora fastidiosa]MBU7005720.1 Zn-dependent protease with chaperone function [Phosphitispora fastidiosa]
MFYTMLVKSYVHPFILYVLFGTLAGYLAVLLLLRLPLFKDTRSRAVLFGIPLVVPVAAYVFRGPLRLDRCAVYGHSIGQIDSWLCFAGNILAVILTPLFFASVIFAAARIILSIYASRSYVKKYGYASDADRPQLFAALKILCLKAEMKVPRVIVTRDIFARAFTMGFRSPVLVLSEGLLSGLDEDELETVMAHELGHIVRGDSLLNRILLFLKDIMFFVPLANMVFRNYSAEKEKASDDFAVRLTGKPMAFAQALIKVWKMSRHSIVDELLPYPSLAGNGGVLEKRVERLLEGEHKIIGSIWFTAAAAMVITGLSVFVLQWVC